MHVEGTTRLVSKVPPCRHDFCRASGEGFARGPRRRHRARAAVCLAARSGSEDTGARARRRGRAATARHRSCHVRCRPPLRTAPAATRAVGCFRRRTPRTLYSQVLGMPRPPAISLGLGDMLLSGARHNRCTYEITSGEWQQVPQSGGRGLKVRHVGRAFQLDLDAEALAGGSGGGGSSGGGSDDGGSTENDEVAWARATATRAARPSCRRRSWPTAGACGSRSRGASKRHSRGGAGR